MTVDLIIRHCSPTLAGLKVGNLFSFRFESQRQLYREMHQRNKKLNSKGIYFEVLRKCDSCALVYVYRKNQLIQELNRYEVKEFMRSYGYTGGELESYIQTLKEHLKYEQFPHEIGLFLGYPLYDVKCFIKNKGYNSKLVGVWKVYGDEHEAEKTFARFRKCSLIYSKKLSQGFDITQLTVAG